MREYTNKISDLVAEGLFNHTYLIDQLLMWMSEDDVKEFYLTNIAPELDIDEEDDE